MCLSGSFSHSDFVATGQQTALKSKHFFFKECIYDYRMISGTTAEAVDKIYLCHLPRAYSAGFWNHPSPRLEPSTRLPCQTQLQAQLFRQALTSEWDFGLQHPQSGPRAPGDSTPAWIPGPSRSGLRRLFYTAWCGTCICICFTFLYPKLWL